VSVPTPISPPRAPSGRRFFTGAQLVQLKAVFSAIWPGRGDAPGATDAGAADYLDLLLGDPDPSYEEIPNWRAQYVAGLGMLEGAAQTRASRSLDAISADELHALLEELSLGKLPGFPDAPWQQSFFGLLRGHCIEGCLADPRWGGNQGAVMWRWLGYPAGGATSFTRANGGTNAGA